MACTVTVLGGALPQQEINAYIARAREKFGVEPKAINITLLGDEVELDYELPRRPFQRIRRITGYLVGTLDRFNDAKRREESERVKHGGLEAWGTASGGLTGFSSHKTDAPAGRRFGFC